MSRPTTALVLGSGGARGWAHIGVVKALRELEIDVDLVTGTSMGSLVGAAVASRRVNSLHQAALSLDWKHLFQYFFEFTFPRTGLVDGTKIVEFLNKQIYTADIEQLPIPYAAVAADVVTGEKHILNKGDLISAVRASISVPGIFAPIRHGEALLVDGGILDPVPIDVAKDMGAEVTIAVNLNKSIGDMTQSPLLPGPNVKPVDKIEKGVTDFISKLNEMPLVKKKPIDIEPVKQWFHSQKTPDILEILGNSLRIMESQLAQFQLAAHPPDILIEPCVNHIKFMDFHRADEAIQLGYQETIRVAQQEKDKLAESFSLPKGILKKIAHFFED